MLSQLPLNLSENELHHVLNTLTVELGEDDFCQAVAEQLVCALSPERVLPSTLKHFEPLVSIGMTFFLSRLSAKRLRGVVVKIFAQGMFQNINHALLQLALQFPTLHKLGQILARNPGVDQDLKKSLIQLEHGLYRDNFDEYIQEITTQLNDINFEKEFRLGPDILAEASVAAVIPFYCKNNGDVQGVFKILKPGTKQNLEEELKAMTETAIFLEEKRHSLGLKNMNVIALFEEIAVNLQKETDLSAERAKLRDAKRIYQNDEHIRIPDLFPLCSTTMTAMEYLDGQNIADHDILSGQENEFAGAVFEAVICSPLFSLQESALFHGDPHAGNILAIPDKSEALPHIGLIDWTLAGYLTRTQRMSIMKLLLGIIKKDSRTLARILNELTGTHTHEETDNTLEIIDETLQNPSYKDFDPLKKSFILMEQFTLHGGVFPPELILYRKAFFTLEGVLNDISPGFSMSNWLERYLAELLLKEIPLRCFNWYMPWDNGSHYRTMLSNLDLHDLIIQQSLGQWMKMLNDCTSTTLSGLEAITELYMAGINATLLANYKNVNFK